MGFFSKIAEVLSKGVSTASFKQVVVHPRLGPVTFHRRKGSKNIRLSVSASGGLLLSYPWLVSLNQARAFLDNHEAWAQAALEKVRQRTQNKRTLLPQEVEALRKKAKAELLPRLAQLAQQYHFSYNQSFIKNNKSNWGSCSAVNNINLNLKLILLPEHLRDYVILHELCHTRIKNHGPRFWMLLNSITDGKAKMYAKELKQLKIIILSTLLLIAVACNKHHDDLPPEKETVEFQEPELDASYYWNWEQKVPVQKMDGKFYVEFYTAQEDEIIDECEKAGITIHTIHKKGDYFGHVHTYNPGVAKFTGRMAAFIEGSYEQSATLLSSMLYWSHFYQYMSGEEIKITSLFTGVMSPKATIAQLEQLAKKYSVEMIGRDIYTSNWYHFACTTLSKGDALEMANLFSMIGPFAIAIPNIIGAGSVGAGSLCDE